MSKGTVMIHTVTVSARDVNDAVESTVFADVTDIEIEGNFGTIQLLPRGDILEVVSLHSPLGIEPRASNVVHLECKRERY